MLESYHKEVQEHMNLCSLQLLPESVHLLVLGSDGDLSEKCERKGAIEVGSKLENAHLPWLPAGSALW
jgi:hypothetical protein